MRTFVKLFQDGARVDAAIWVGDSAFSTRRGTILKEGAGGFYLIEFDVTVSYSRYLMKGEDSRRRWCRHFNITALSLLDLIADAAQ